jgi:hypothetical protein
MATNVTVDGSPVSDLAVVSTLPTPAELGAIAATARGAANGVAPLGASSLVPVANLGSGTPTGSKFLRDDGTFAVPAGGGGGGTYDVVTPAVNNLKAWTYDALLAVSAFAITAGVVKMGRAPIDNAFTAAKAWTNITQVGSGGSPANGFLGVYTLSGGVFTLVGKTSDQAAAWSTGSAGPRSATLTAEAGQSLALTDDVWLALLIGTQATTGIQILRSGSGNATANLGLTAGTDPLRFSTVKSGLSALPATINVSDGTFATDFAGWFGLGL